MRILDDSITKYDTINNPAAGDKFCAIPVPRSGRYCVAVHPFDGSAVAITKLAVNDRTAATLPPFGQGALLTPIYLSAQQGDQVAVQFVQASGTSHKVFLVLSLVDDEEGCRR